MKALATLFTLLGVMAMTTPDMALQNANYKPHSVAVNFAIYRNAVNKYVIGNSPLAAEEISASLLDLPSGWKPMRIWANRLNSGNCYVWGPVQKAEAAEISKLFMGSHAIGVKRNGSLVTAHGTGIALPVFIPEKSIVSVISQ